MERRKSRTIDLPDLKTDFSKMVDNDINRCDKCLSGDCQSEQMDDLHLELITKYPQYVFGFGKSLYCYSEQFGFNPDMCDNETMIYNLKVMRNKLIAFKTHGYKNNNSLINDNSINIENNLKATQSQNVTITFEEVKRNIENMTALSERETEETLKKVGEMKDIIESTENKKTKWQKMKPILLWLADKSVDVGMVLLPYLLKIQN